MPAAKKQPAAFTSQLHSPERVAWEVAVDVLPHGGAQPQAVSMLYLLLGAPFCFLLGALKRYDAQAAVPGEFRHF